MIEWVEREEERKTEGSGKKDRGKRKEREREDDRMGRKGRGKKERGKWK